MNKIEKSIISGLEKKKLTIFATAITILAIGMRFAGKDFTSSDMADFFIPWFHSIKEQGGIAALRNQVGNYSITYQFLIAIFTYLPIPAAYGIKLFSAFFDFVLAVVTAMLLCEVKKEKSSSLAVWVYAVVLLLPTTVMNSSYWGQCDSLYTTFIVLSLLLLRKKKFVWAFIVLGAGFACKLQTIFILPFFVYYYVKEKQFSIFHFAIILASDYILCIPGFLFGRMLLDPVRIYFWQTKNYPNMYLNFPSAWGLVGDSYDAMKPWAILFTIALLGIGCMVLLEKKISLQGNQFLYVSVWSLWTVLLFLPAMHERYSYALDILLVAIVFLDIRFFKISAIAIIISTITYGNYLFSTGIDCRLLSAFYLAAYLYYSYLLLGDKKPALSGD